jgi:AcrR family transcriptional regulator
MSADEKEHKVEAVAAATAKLLWQHGLEGVTHARLARASGVSRAWLYKYLGNEKEDLLRFVTEHFGAMLAKFQTRPRVDSKENWIDDTVQGVFVLIVQAQQFPWVMPLYYRYVGTDSELGRCIAEIEERYLDTATIEIAKVFGMPETRARWAAELMLTLRACIAYRQSLTGFVAMNQLEELRKLLQSWSRAL